LTVDSRQLTGIAQGSKLKVHLKLLSFEF